LRQPDQPARHAGLGGRVAAAFLQHLLASCAAASAESHTRDYRAAHAAGGSPRTHATDARDVDAAALTRAVVAQARRRGQRLRRAVALVVADLLIRLQRPGHADVLDAVDVVIRREVRIQSDVGVLEVVLLLLLIDLGHEFLILAGRGLLVRVAESAQGP